MVGLEHSSAVILIAGAMSAISAGSAAASTAQLVTLSTVPECKYDPYDLDCQGEETGRCSVRVAGRRWSSRWTGAPYGLRSPAGVVPPRFAGRFSRTTRRGGRGPMAKIPAPFPFCLHASGIRITSGLASGAYYGRARFERGQAAVEDLRALARIVALELDDLGFGSAFPCPDR